MTTRIGSAFSSCAIKSKSESVEIITSSSEDDIDSQIEAADIKTENANNAVEQPQSSFLWRMSSGLIGGVYNGASVAAGGVYNGASVAAGGVYNGASVAAGGVYNAAGMGVNSTTWVLGKGVDIVSNVPGMGNVISKTADVGTSIISIVPSRLRGKDKKE